MSLIDDIKDVLEADDDLMEILTGGIFAGVEEISRQNTAGAFDGNGEIQPAALIKESVENKTGPYAGSVQSSLRIFYYQFSGYDKIEAAMDIVFGLLNEKQIGDGVWNVSFSNAIHGQRDAALDCPLCQQTFTVVRNR